MTDGRSSVNTRHNIPGGKIVFLALRSERRGFMATTREKGTTESREKIVEAGRHLFGTKGFDKTTIEDLIEIIGTDDEHFFHYFESLDELLEVIWSESSKPRQREEKKLYR